MSDQKTQNDAFHNLRNGFDELQVDDQARFLVEAAMSLVANGAREAGNAVSSVIDDLVETVKKESACEEEPAEAKASEPAPPRPKAKKKPAAKKPRAKRAPKTPPGDA